MSIYRANFEQPVQDRKCKVTYKQELVIIILKESNRDNMEKDKLKIF